MQSQTSGFALVLEEPKIRFFVGMPLIIPEGMALGGFRNQRRSAAAQHRKGSALPRVPAKTETPAGLKISDGSRI
jgi:hypothetical protein